MRHLKKRIVLLEKRARAWRDFLSRNPTGRDDVPVTWALMELATAIGMLEEAAAAYRALWPESQAWVDKKSSNSRVIAEAYRAPIQEGVESVVLERVNAVGHGLAQASSSEDLIEALGEIRELLSLAGFRPGDVVRAVMLLEHFEEKLTQTLSRLASEDRRVVREWTCSLLANDWLYGWVRGLGDELYEQRYAILRSAAGLGKGGRMIGRGGDLHNVLGASDISDNLRPLIEAVLKRLEEVVDQDGYEALFDILDDGGWIFGGVAPGAEGEMNVIPGRRQGRCAPLLLAFARGSGRRGMQNALNTMRKVREHLIQCMGTTRVVVYFAPLADIGKALEESVGDLEAHLASRSLKAFLPISVFNNTLTVHSWRNP